MTPRRWFLLILLLTLTGLNVLTYIGSGQRSLRVLPEMWDSPALKSLGATDVFPSGVVQQLPPEGTLPHGFAPVSYTPDETGSEEAGRELRNPFDPSPEILALGRTQFTEFCTPCHGAQADGNGLVPQRGFPAPPSLLAESARNLADGAVFHLVTFGRNNMPSYRFQLTVDDRWAVIHWVRRLQQETQAGGTPQ